MDKGSRRLSVRSESRWENCGNSRENTKILLDRQKLHSYNDKACVIRLRVLLKSVKTAILL